MGLLTVSAASSGRRRSFRMQRQSPSLRDGLTELPSSRRNGTGTPQSDTPEPTFTPKKKERKWTLSGLFRRRKNKSSDTENSSSLEEVSPGGGENNSKFKAPGFLARKLSLKKKRNGSRKVVGKFDFAKNPEFNGETPLIIQRDSQLVQNSSNSSEKLSSLNSSSQFSSKQKFDSLTLLQTGSSCGSLSSSGKRSSKQDVKARVEAEHEKLKDSSSDDEFGLGSGRKFHSQDNINDSLKRRTRAARTERYLKRLNQINNLPYHQQAELLRMLDRNNWNHHNANRNFTFEPSSHHLKAQSANSSLANSPLPNIKFTFCHDQQHSLQNNVYVNVADSKHNKLTKSLSKPSPILPRHKFRRIEIEDSPSSVDDRIYMNVTSPITSKVPPAPPPRDPHRKVIATYSSPNCLNFGQRPVSYAFEAPKFTSVDNLTGNRSNHHPVHVNGNHRSSSEQHIERPSSVLEYSTNVNNYQYVTDHRPRSRRPIQIENLEEPSKTASNQLKPNNRLYFSDQHINNARLTESGSRINSSEEQVWKSGSGGGKLQSDNSMASTPDYNRDSKSNFQFNKASEDQEHASLDHPAYLSRRNSKEIGQFARPLSMVLEKSESEVESPIKSSNPRISKKSAPPDPPIRKNFGGKKRITIGKNGEKIETSISESRNELPIGSVKSVDIDELLLYSKQHNSSNLEDALNELEEIYKSLQLSDDDLLDRAERRDIPAQLHAILSRDIDSLSSEDETDGPERARIRRERTRSLSSDRKKDDMAYRRIFKTDNPNFVPKLDTCNIMSQAGSYLLVSPTLAPPVFPNLSEPPMSPVPNNEPDVTYDDVVFRNIKHANNSLRTMDPQPPFGIPLGPITQAACSDYLHAIPENRYKPTFSSRRTPDVVKDDLAFRNLRKDLEGGGGDDSRDYRKKRAIRSLSANLSGLTRAEKLKYSFPHPHSYGRSSSYNDLPNQCLKEFDAKTEPSISQLYSTASTESLTDYDVIEFLRHRTPANYEELLRKFNSQFESSVLNGIVANIDSAGVESNDNGRTISPSLETKEIEVKELIKAIESNKLNKNSLQEKIIIQRKPIVLSTFNQEIPKGIDPHSDYYNPKATPCVAVAFETKESVKRTKSEPDQATKGYLSQIFDLKSFDAIAKSKLMSLETKKEKNSQDLARSKSTESVNLVINSKSTKTPELSEKCFSVMDDLSKSNDNLNSTAPKNNFSSKIDLKDLDYSVSDPKPKLTESSEVKKKRSSQTEGSKKSSKSKRRSLSRDPSTEETAVVISNGFENDSKSVSVKSSDIKKRRNSKIENSEKSRKHEDSPPESKNQRKESKSNGTTESDSKLKAPKSPKTKKKRSSRNNSIEKPIGSEEPSTGEILVTAESKSSDSSENDPKKKSSKSPKIKRKRSSKISLHENLLDDKEKAIPGEPLKLVEDLKSESKSLNDTSSKSSKSPRERRKRSSLIETPEKVRRSKESLQSCIASEQPLSLKARSSAEADLSRKSNESPDERRKSLGHIEIPEIFRKSNENLASNDGSVQRRGSKSRDVLGNESTLKTTNSPNERRKSASQIEIPEIFRKSNENLASCDILGRKIVSKSSDGSENDHVSKVTRIHEDRRKHSSPIEIPEKFKESKENLASNVVSEQKLGAKSIESSDNCSLAQSATSPLARRKRSSQIEIPHIFKENKENVVSGDVLELETSLKSIISSGNDPNQILAKSPQTRRKRSSQIEIPEIFRENKENVDSVDSLRQEHASSPPKRRESEKIRTSKVPLVTNDFRDQEIDLKSSKSLELESKLKPLELIEDRSEAKTPEKLVITSNPILQGVKKTDGNISDACKETRKTPLKSILKKPSSKVCSDDDKREKVHSNVDKNSEDSGVAFESIIEPSLTSINSCNVVDNLAASAKKMERGTPDGELNSIQSPCFISELNCLLQRDQNLLVTNESVQIIETDVRGNGILKSESNENGIVGSKIMDRSDGTESSVIGSKNVEKCLEQPEYTFNPINDADVLVGKVEREICFDDTEMRTERTYLLGNGHVVTATEKGQELSDKEEIISALNKLTSQIEASVTDCKFEGPGSSPESRELEVTKTTEFPCSTAQSHNGSNQVQSSSGANNQLQQFRRRSSPPKSANQTNLTESALSSCSDFEGIALSTSSLLAASYCFACLLQSDYLSLVNLMAAILVLVACFVLYHVLAAE